jgi:hypothetical protein
MHELIPPLVCNAFQIAQIARVCELVQINDGGLIPFHPLQDEIGSDKTCSPRDEDRVFHIVEFDLEFNRTRPLATQ